MAQGLNRDKCLRICGISKHQFYYESGSGKRGRKPSQYTLQFVEGKPVERSNESVQICIKNMFKNPLIDYGYHRMTGALQLAGYRINHKKVYRLMREAYLLRAVKPKTKKNYVKYRVVCPEAPLRLMEMDIKQVWISSSKRYAYIFTIIDIFTRVVLYWEVGYSITQQQVQGAWEQIIKQYLEPYGALAWEGHIEVRSDNGPQFVAKKLRKFLQENYFYQTFTHPYTPQENGHVESFHAILSDTLRGSSFYKLSDLEAQLIRFYEFYNYERIHGSTLLLPPMTFWQQWQLGNIKRTLIDAAKRKVNFELLCARYEIKCVERLADIPSVKKLPTASGNGHQRAVSSLNSEGSIPDAVQADIKQANKKQPAPA